MARSKITSSQITSPVLTQANAGSAGGTINYVNEGGVKRAWGITAAYGVAGNTNTSAVITLPTSFFTTITGASLTLGELTTDGRQVPYFTTAPTASSISVSVQALTGTASPSVGGKWYWEVRGT